MSKHDTMTVIAEITVSMKLSKVSEFAIREPGIAEEGNWRCYNLLQYRFSSLSFRPHDLFANEVSTSAEVARIRFRAEFALIISKEYPGCTFECLLRQFKQRNLPRLPVWLFPLTVPNTRLVRTLLQYKSSRRKGIPWLDSVMGGFS